MDFFESLPPARRTDDDAPEPVPPEWLGPPRDVLGGLVALSEPVVRSEHLFLALRSVTAYRTGLSVDLVLGLRRGDVDQAGWDALCEAFWGERGIPRRTGPREGELRLGLELADGRRTGVLDRSGRFPGTPPEPPVLVALGGGGSGGRSMADKRMTLWIWPLPEGAAISLVVQWPELDLPLTYHRIDLAPVEEAVARARDYWPATGAGA